jgi:membrane-associated phospholipid phosphatase
MGWSRHPFQVNLVGMTPLEPMSPRRVLLRRMVLSLAFATFGALLLGLPVDGPFTFERAVIDSMADGRSDGVTLVFQGITRVGDGWVLILLTVAGVLLIRPGSTTWAIFFGAAVAGAAVLNQVIKHLVARARPMDPEPILSAGGFAFPSGHAMGTAAFALGFYFVVRALVPRFQWAAAAVGVVFVGAVGASRVYLGVHYPTDVLAGWALGTAWVVLLGGWMARWTERRAALTTPPQTDT